MASESFDEMHAALGEHQGTDTTAYVPCVHIGGVDGYFMLKNERRADGKEVRAHCPIPCDENVSSRRVATDRQAYRRTVRRADQ